MAACNNTGMAYNHNRNCGYRFRAGLNLKEIHKVTLKGVLHPGIVCASSKMSEKEVALFFNFKGGLFSNIF